MSGSRADCAAQKKVADKLANEACHSFRRASAARHKAQSAAHASGMKLQSADAWRDDQICGARGVKMDVQ
jgi:hypothetical protein